MQNERGQKPELLATEVQSTTPETTGQTQPANGADHTEDSINGIGSEERARFAPDQIDLPDPPTSPAVGDEPGVVDPPKQAGPRLSSGPIRNEVISYQSFAPLPHQPAWEMLPNPPRAFSPPQPTSTPPNTPLTHVPWQVSDSWGATTLNISANTAAGASYLFWWVSGFLFYFSERNNRFVRFHALQSIILTGMLTIIGVGAVLFATIMHDLAAVTHQVIFYHMGVGAAILLALIIVFAWLWTMIAAWTGNYLRLPVIGSYAERYSAPPAQPTRNPLL